MDYLLIILDELIDGNEGSIPHLWVLHADVVKHLINDSIPTPRKVILQDHTQAHCQLNSVKRKDHLFSSEW